MKFIFNEQNKDTVINLDKVSLFAKVNDRRFESKEVLCIRFYIDSATEQWEFKTESERSAVFDELKRLIEVKEI